MWLAGRFRLEIRGLVFPWFGVFNMSNEVLPFSILIGMTPTGWEAARYCSFALLAAWCPRCGAGYELGWSRDPQHFTVELQPCRLDVDSRLLICLEIYLAWNAPRAKKSNLPLASLEATRRSCSLLDSLASMTVQDCRSIHTLDGINLLGMGNIPETQLIHT